MPPVNDAPSIIPPVKIGYTSKKDVSLCSGSSLGRITIVHAPNAIPLSPGEYEVIVVGASRSNYSLSVQMNVAYTVEQRIDLDR